MEYKVELLTWELSECSLHSFSFTMATSAAYILQFFEYLYSFLFEKHEGNMHIKAPKVRVFFLHDTFVLINVSKFVIVSLQITHKDKKVLVWLLHKA